MLPLHHSPIFSLWLYWLQQSVGTQLCNFVGYILIITNGNLWKNFLVAVLLNIQIHPIVGIPSWSCCSYCTTIHVNACQCSWDRMMLYSQITEDFPPPHLTSKLPVSGGEYWSIVIVLLLFWVLCPFCVPIHKKKKKKKKKKQCYPLGSSYLVGKSVKYGYIEFFVFDYDSLPISFQSGITFPLVALDKIVHH